MEKNNTFLLRYSMCQSNDKCQRYHSFKKSAPNHRSLTLKGVITSQQSSRLPSQSLFQFPPQTFITQPSSSIGFGGCTPPPQGNVQACNQIGSFNTLHAYPMGRHQGQYYCVPTRSQRPLGLCDSVVWQIMGYGLFEITK